MKTRRTRIVALVVLVGCLLPQILGAQTFMLDMKTQMALSDMEPGERSQILALETGFMDALFDNGFIFFNMYTVLDDPDDLGADLLPLHHSKREGADFLVRFTPRGNAVHWQLIQVEPVASLGEGSVTLGDTTTAENDSAYVRWSALGTLCSQRVFDEINHL